MQPPSSIPMFTPENQDTSIPIPTDSNPVAEEPAETFTNDTVSLPQTILDEVSTPQEEPEYRPQRIRRTPERLHYETLGNPS